MSTSKKNWREHLGHIIFETNTPASKAFDVCLLVAIIASVTAVVVESIPGMRESYGLWIDIAEWAFTILFTIEYVFRILTFPRPKEYIFSFFGMVDLLAIIPSYLGVFFVGMESLLVIRAIRLLRVFRVLKLMQFSKEALVLVSAMRRSLVKIIVFIGAVLTVVVIAGATMYLIEGEEHGFTSIPKAMYWAIVTMTTVGYGDLVPQTAFGRVFASFLMIIGYGIIAVPTGIVSVEIAQSARESEAKSDALKTDTISTSSFCESCSQLAHESDSKFCRVCGARLAKLKT